MPWSKLWSASSEPEKTDTTTKPIQRAQEAVSDAFHAAEEKAQKLTTNSSSPSTPSLSHAFTEPKTLLATVILTTACLGCFRLYKTYLRRIPEATNIDPSYFRKRSIFGKVTSVGDGDNFRIFHTPGGWLAGWGWLPWRNVPRDRKLLKNNTIHIRIAGIDAPELAHFGRPAQPHSQESLQWLTSYLLGRRVRAYVYKNDQYSRVVATVYVWKGFLRRDVGLQMLKAGCATVYEAKQGAEFGEGLESKYRSAEQWAKSKKKGMWAGNMQNYESPREYKNRYTQPETSSKR